MRSYELPRRALIAPVRPLAHSIDTDIFLASIPFRF